MIFFLLVTHSQVLWGGQGANFKKGKNSVPPGDLSHAHAITWQQPQGMWQPVVILNEYFKHFGWTLPYLFFNRTTKW